MFNLDRGICYPTECFIEIDNFVLSPTFAREVIISLCTYLWDLWLHSGNITLRAVLNADIQFGGISVEVI